MYKLTFLEAFFSSILWIVLLAKYSPAFQIQNQNKGNYKFFTIALLIFSVFGFTAGADFFHYYEGYEIAYRVGRGHWEPFYNYLVDALPYGYYYWRFVVWGLSVILLVLTFKRLQTPPYLSCLIFVLVLIFYFSAPRNTLGYVALYYSITYIIKPIRNKSLSYFVGLVGILLSTTLHKSMPLYIGIMLCSFFPMKRWTYIVSLCAFPILYGSFYDISSYVLTLGDDAFQDRGAFYLEGENFAKSNVFGYIQLLFERIPLLILLLYSISQILKKKIQDKSAILFIQYSYWLIYISFLFYKQSTSSFLSPRFWDASLYPLAFALPAILYQKKEKIVIWSLYILVFTAISYKIIYPIYKI